MSSLNMDYGFITDTGRALSIDEARLYDECLAESDGDRAAAEQAAEVLLSMTPEQRAQLAQAERNRAEQLPILATLNKALGEFAVERAAALAIVERNERRFL